MLRVRNLTKDSTLAASARHARSAWQRTRGLLGHPPLGPGEGLVIEPCNSVHTLFMGYALDVVFAADDATVLGVQTIAPWRFSKLWWGARYAIELPSGSAADTSAGDQLSLEDAA